MVQDGTQGTTDGAGLVQNLNLYGNPYSAARGYNSGYIPKSGDLSEAAGATACYVTDIANRLTGWVNAKSTCPGKTRKATICGLLIVDRNLARVCEKLISNICVQTGLLKLRLLDTRNVKRLT